MSTTFCSWRYARSRRGVTNPSSSSQMTSGVICSRGQFGRGPIRLSIAQENSSSARNRVATAAAVLVLVSLIVGLVGTVWQAHRATVQKARAERRFNDVRKLAHSVL